ncbi:MAG TPA: ISL3 family transposase, partial [Ktedonobacteraceae bacterium]
MVTSTNLVACCPVCQTASRQVHCYYRRTVTDLCWADFQVQLKLHVRRFVCSNVMCTRRTFAERLGEPIKAYARRTKRCASRLQTIGLMLGGNAGAHLAKRMGLSVSADTLLRLVRAFEVPERVTPEVLGIDDFALLKGQKYGTILVDLEKRHPVDLLPDREKTTVAAWLKAHPGVKLISRDRGGSYAEAAREAAPRATQIADRFHLSQNLSETLERILRREYPTIEQIFAGVAQDRPSAESSLPLQRHEADKQVSQQRRMTVYECVISLSEQGYNQDNIATQLRMSRKKVRQLLQGPPRPPVYKSRPTKLMPYMPYLKQRFAEEGCDNSLQLYREIRTRGYDGCRSVVTNYVTQLRQQAGINAMTGRKQSRQPKPLKGTIPAPGPLRWCFLLPEEQLNAKQNAHLALLCQCEAKFAVLHQLAQSFVRLLHEQTDAGLTPWFKEVQRSRVPELISFAKGLQRDEAAVRAGLSLKWS